MHERIPAVIFSMNKNFVSEIRNSRKCCSDGHIFIAAQPRKLFGLRISDFAFLFYLLAVLFAHATHAAIVTVGPWVPTFKGVELATGRQQRQTAGEHDLQLLCLRIDLTDPDVKLFTTPHCPNCNLETVSENTSHFLEQYGLQVAVNGGFYSSSTGPTDTPLGTAEDVFGLAISEGTVVSPADDAGYRAALLFTTNNLAFYAPTNFPATNTTGIYTAVGGNQALLVNGINVRPSTPNDLDPRTAFGLSSDRRYLYLMTLDGRQPGWSDGADFHDTGEWLKRFGASDGINVDGGGSTTMVMSDCVGAPVRLNRSSYVAAYGRERNIGHNFGVYARPLPSEQKELTVNPGTTTAVITWRTDFAATTQMDYGPTQSYGSGTAFDPRPMKNHITTLYGLTQGSNYFFRAISTAGEQQYTQACRFSTLTSINAEELFALTKSWTYTTNNLDGVNWKAPNYDDANWLGQGPGLLYVENNTAVAPKNTALPPPFGQIIPRTYYFRTHFNFTGSLAGASLIFSNYVDDGAVFYLNGAEIYRLRMPAAPTLISSSTAATGVPCPGTVQSGDAATICPDVFTIGGNLLANLMQGDNVLAVEVHNYTTGNDLVFGTALIANRPALVLPRLNMWLEGNQATLFWNGEGFTMQQSSDLASPANWFDLPGPVTQSPLTVTNAATMFYRLRN